ncbi:MAG: hypothetical protein QXT81_00380 [Candidatus Bathyarchaeia archaeon]
MDQCESCAQKLEKLEECPYCKKHLCPSCYVQHMNWEKQHQDWSLYQTSAGGGLHPETRGMMSYGPVYQTEQERRRYRRRRPR